MINKEFILKFKEYCDAYGWQFDNSCSEFTFQFRLGWFINFYYANQYVIDFESNIKTLCSTEHKKEIDILIADRNTNKRQAIEVKFVKDKSGYDITLFEMCKDIKFLEDLVELPQFEKSYAIAFSSIAKAYTPPANGKYRITGQRLAFYKNFREHLNISGTMYRNEKTQYHFDKEYKLEWFDFTDVIKACIVCVEKKVVSKQ